MKRRPPRTTRTDTSCPYTTHFRSHARTAKEREQMAQRYTNEVVRRSMYGTMRPEKYPELAAHLARIAPAKPARKSVKKPAKPAAKKAVKKAPAGKSRSK